MPFINGLGLLYRLRAGEPHRRTPVVIVTGDQCLDDAVIDEVRDLGAEIRFKPLWLEDLVDVARVARPGRAASSCTKPAPSARSRGRICPED